MLDAKPRVMKLSITRLPTTSDGRFDVFAYIDAKASQSGIDVPADLLPAVAALLEVMAAGAHSLDCSFGLGQPEQRSDPN